MPTKRRSLRRWLRKTPSSELAYTLMGIGSLLVLVALVVLGLRMKWF